MAYGTSDDKEIRDITLMDDAALGWGKPPLLGPKHGRKPAYRHWIRRVAASILKEIGAEELPASMGVAGSHLIFMAFDEDKQKDFVKVYPPLDDAMQRRFDKAAAGHKVDHLVTAVGTPPAALDIDQYTSRDVLFEAAFYASFKPISPAALHRRERRVSAKLQEMARSDVDVAQMSKLEPARIDFDGIMRVEIPRVDGSCSISVKDCKEFYLALARLDRRVMRLLYSAHNPIFIGKRAYERTFDVKTLSVALPDQPPYMLDDATINAGDLAFCLASNILEDGALMVEQLPPKAAADVAELFIDVAERLTYEVLTRTWTLYTHSLERVADDYEWASQLHEDVEPLIIEYTSASDEVIDANEIMEEIALLRDGKSNPMRLAESMRDPAYYFQDWGAACTGEPKDEPEQPGLFMQATRSTKAPKRTPKAPAKTSPVNKAKVGKAKASKADIQSQLLTLMGQMQTIRSRIANAIKAGKAQSGINIYKAGLKSLQERASELKAAMTQEPAATQAPATQAPAIKAQVLKTQLLRSGDFNEAIEEMAASLEEGETKFSHGVHHPDIAVLIRSVWKKAAPIMDAGRHKGADIMVPWGTVHDAIVKGANNRTMPPDTLNQLSLDDEKKTRADETAGLFDFHAGGKPKAAARNLKKGVLEALKARHESLGWFMKSAFAGTAKNSIISIEDDKTIAFKAGGVFVRRPLYGAEVFVVPEFGRRPALTWQGVGNIERVMKTSAGNTLIEVSPKGVDSSFRVDISRVLPSHKESQSVESAFDALAKQIPGWTDKDKDSLQSLGLALGRYKDKDWLTGVRSSATEMYMEKLGELMSVDKDSVTLSSVGPAIMDALSSMTATMLLARHAGAGDEANAIFDRYMAIYKPIEDKVMASGYMSRRNFDHERLDDPDLMDFIKGKGQWKHISMVPHSDFDPKVLARLKDYLETSAAGPGLQLSYAASGWGDMTLYSNGRVNLAINADGEHRLFGRHRFGPSFWSDAPAQLDALRGRMALLRKELKEVVDEVSLEPSAEAKEHGVVEASILKQRDGNYLVEYRLQGEGYNRSLFVRSKNATEASSHFYRHFRDKSIAAKARVEADRKAKQETARAKSKKEAAEHRLWLSHIASARLVANAVLSAPAPVKVKSNGINYTVVGNACAFREREFGWVISRWDEANERHTDEFVAVLNTLRDTTGLLQVAHSLWAKGQSHDDVQDQINDLRSNVKLKWPFDTNAPIYHAGLKVAMTEKLIATINRINGSFLIYRGLSNTVKFVPFASALKDMVAAVGHHEPKGITPNPEPINVTDRVAYGIHPNRILIQPVKDIADGVYDKKGRPLADNDKNKRVVKASNSKVDRVKDIVRSAVEAEGATVLEIHIESLRQVIKVIEDDPLLKGIPQEGKGINLRVNDGIVYIFQKDIEGSKEHSAIIGKVLGDSTMSKTWKFFTKDFARLLGRSKALEIVVDDKSVEAPVIFKLDGQRRLVVAPARKLP